MVVLPATTARLFSASGVAAVREQPLDLRVPLLASTLSDYGQALDSQ